jgi:ABC-2 type transport system ATP-binding protein
MTPNSLSAPAIVLDEVTKTFPSGFTAVNEITCSIPQGSIVGLLGPNGAGKTTLMHMLLGTLSPSSGSIRYFGQELTMQAAARSDILRHIGFASSYVRLPGKLSLEDNLLFYGQLYGQTRIQARERMNSLLKVFDLHALKERACYSLSAGQATRLMIAKAFMGFPRVVLLDEPTASLDVDIAQAVLYFIKHQQQTEGTTILFTSHKIEEVGNLCEKVLVIQQGKLIAYAPPAELIQLYAYSRIRVLSRTPDTVMQWAQQRQYTGYMQDGWIYIEVPETQMPQALVSFSQHITTYEQLAIEPPTLNTYFLRLASGAS